MADFHRCPGCGQRSDATTYQIGGYDGYCGSCFVEAHPELLEYGVIDNTPRVAGALEVLGKGGVTILAAIEVLRDTPDEVWERALARASKAEALGPILDPSAWNQAGAFEQHRRWRDVFQACRELGRIARGED